MIYGSIISSSDKSFIEGSLALSLLREPEPYAININHENFINQGVNAVEVPSSLTLTID
jgi:hypothetical protein